jgi:hypothetical protein
LYKLNSPFKALETFVHIRLTQDIYEVDIYGAASTNPKPTQKKMSLDKKLQKDLEEAEAVENKKQALKNVRLYIYNNCNLSLAN